MRIAVIKYPGTNDLAQTVYALASCLKHEVEIVDDSSESVGEVDGVVVPGGFSYGDHLRPGGLAKASRISGPIRAFAQSGKTVIGIGNGFQILCELGVLPGAFLPNSTGRFAGGYVSVRVENRDDDQLNNTVLSLPIGCYQGRYYVDRGTLKDLEDNGSVLLRFCDGDGEVDDDLNPTGAVNSIAGVTNRQRNVIGMVVHPERAVEKILDRSGFESSDGLRLLSALLLSSGQLAAAL